MHTQMLDNGFEIIERFITDVEIKKILNDIKNFKVSKGQGGIRNIDKKSSIIASFCTSKSVRDTAAHYLAGDAKLVRAIYFNKTPDQNWLVTWHQDKLVAVSEKFDAPGWHTWSIKENILHVQPPVEVLNQMITIRIHLDATDDQNGCLKVIPGSHRLGILDQKSIHEQVATNQPVLCAMKRGSALIMRPHLLHSSSKSNLPLQRRVLHLEFSSYKLPSPIQWASNI